jgi:hypothetical protein
MARKIIEKIFKNPTVFLKDKNFLKSQENSRKKEKINKIRNERWYTPSTKIPRNLRSYYTPTN